MKLFRRKPKIIQISSCVTEGYFFTVGLGNDGNCYLWDKVDCIWVPHKVERPMVADAVETPSGNES